MATGTVKWFNATKGYGFIQPDDGSKDVFVHVSDVERSGMDSLREGQKVSFEVREDPQGKRTRSVASRQRSSEGHAAIAIGEAEDRSATYGA
jgi:CspA family cold shock protein